MFRSSIHTEETATAAAAPVVSSQEQPSARIFRSYSIDADRQTDTQTRIGLSGTQGKTE